MRLGMLTFSFPAPSDMSSFVRKNVSISNRIIFSCF